jgi:glycosyltransferase involved in cell wall biosynthesis
MYQSRKIAVVVPAYNEELLIGMTLQSIPNYIDKVYVIDDGSIDNTYKIIEDFSLQDDRIIPIKHEVNKGVGAAIVSGYKRAIVDDVDVTVVMAGDAQMDPKYIPLLIDPIITNSADYTKGNRLLKNSHMKGMSPWRKFGNSVLTLLTKISSGYYDIMDPQNGYTAISKSALINIDIDSVYPKYGYCNDMLAKLNVCNLRVIDVSIPAKYGLEKSKIKYGRYIVKVSWLLLNNFFYRLKMKYIYHSLSPIPFLFFLGFVLSPLGLILFISNSSILFPSWVSVPMLIVGIESILIATVLDINDSKYVGKTRIK